MNKTVEYFFTSPSPFSYLGHAMMMSIAQKHDLKINFRPVDIMSLWGESGAVPPGKRPPVRQRYRMIEIQRVGHFRNVCVNAAPSYFPTNPDLADRSICALVSLGLDPADYVHSVGRAIWEQEQEIADQSVLEKLLEECGHDPKHVMEVAGSQQASELRDENTQMAIQMDAVGVPAYVFEGEVFWGQDRLEYLDAMISSGRRSFSAT